MTTIAVGQFWRVRVAKRRYMLGKITRIAGDNIVMKRVNDDGDEFGKIDERHVMIVSPSDLATQLELDNFYGMLVPFGTKKKHICNHNMGDNR